MRAATLTGLAALLTLGACTESRTALRLHLAFGEELGLDQLRITVEPGGTAAEQRLTPVPPARLSSPVEQLVLLPDDWRGAAVRLAVAGLARGQTVASAQAGVVVVEELAVDVFLQLAPLCRDGVCGLPCQPSGPERCDGRDNDCDGLVDEDLDAPPCRLQAGVCQGARKRCGGAAGWQGCTADVYDGYARSRGLPFELEERSCDGADNDCDGQVDEPCARGRLRVERRSEAEAETVPPP